MTPLSVCVVGVGASGTLAAVHLLRAARTAGTPLRLVLVDRTGTFGPGIPYRTPDPGHLLNTAAGKMSALADDDGHFARWAGAAPDSFLPRGEYGRYLTETLIAEQRAAADVATVERVTATVTRLVPHRGGVTVFLADGAPVRTGFAVLAPGADPANPLGRLLSAGAERYVPDPWRGSALDRIDDDAPVLVLGTGLSMMDVAISLTSAHRGTVVHAVSRHGLLPRPHRTAQASPARPVPAPPRQVRSVRDLLRFARRQVSGGGEWREFVDQLRPHTARLWRQLGTGEQRRFLDRVNRYWDVHRHRAAPATHRRVRELVADGALRVHRGRVTGVWPTDGGYRVGLDSGAALSVGWLVNATGAELDVTERPDPLVRRLLADGLARPDPVRLGVATDDAGRLLSLDGHGQPVFTLGVLRRGELFETTAVPEIRGQAAAIAASVHLGSDSPDPRHARGVLREPIQ